MSDPLSEVIQRLQPRAVFSRAIEGAGDWAVRYGAFGQPAFTVILAGQARLAVDGQPPLDLQPGDFVLLPATPGFTLSGGAPTPPVWLDPQAGGIVTDEKPLRHGRLGGDPDFVSLGGWFEFATPDAALLVSLLPGQVHVRGVDRLTRLVQLLREEATDTRPGRELMQARLVDALLIEALRSAPGAGTQPGLLRGLADPRVAMALQQMHACVERAWTMAELAMKAALSRSAFYERFTRAVGLPPMEYLLVWRMTVAKGLLERGTQHVDEIAARVGYRSSSAFATAFRRTVGSPPGKYIRERKTLQEIQK
ncbi:AraC family transcriptional regulator [Arenimonas terrae]|uniref:AraC family transcriptional regulator n=1 Tax=Arenimonas terrae TaxID=2546226 RepID=A0A5C4RS20_9GAMM|nr:AraC family transcriptional regulator [Arenimonas terrae]TNJ33729.1 AraC family transcriptional regulator [Arenimonas terrae]